MKILLISVNREKMPYPVFPLGLAYLVSALRDEVHTTEVLDLCFSKEPSVELKGTLQRFQPDLIGLSLRNLDNLTYPTSISYLKEVEEVIQVCRQYSSAKLVIGGSGYSLAPKELLQYLDVDFGIVGEGEESFLQLVRSLEKDHPISSSPIILIWSPYPRMSPSPHPSFQWRANFLWMTLYLRARHRLEGALHLGLLKELQEFSEGNGVALLVFEAGQGNQRVADFGQHLLPTLRIGADQEIEV